ncbi:hypothetical protein L1D29_17935 [Shewanella insulae]|uniref:hypothetical protein n=1 Tax=Shewanella insulae TaxID=2681496 RepID=UPI001EFDCD2B|nr:hypothetical protein [Shewanella insulae]MCG9714688.1 hypothetical protein [Shewanella insulae]
MNNSNEKPRNLKIVYDPEHEKAIHEWLLMQKLLKSQKEKSNKTRTGGKGNGLKPKN